MNENNAQLTTFNPRSSALIRVPFLQETTPAALKMLLEIKAVRINVEEPFKFTSGWASPVYIDCHKLISYPRIRNTLMDFSASLVLRDIAFESIDAIAGGETAVIPFAAWSAAYGDVAEYPQ